jgi:hypothetical protein
MQTLESTSIEAAHMQPAPIDPSWIIQGSPRARWAELSRSRDRTASTVLWDCTAGEFNWSYADDETVHILEGEAIIENGSMRRAIRPGDVVLFHAGSIWRWRVPLYVKKVAFLRVVAPRPLVLGLRAWRKLKRSRFLSRSRRAPAAFGVVSCWAYGLVPIDPGLLFVPGVA